MQPITVCKRWVVDCGSVPWLPRVTEVGSISVVALGSKDNWALKVLGLSPKFLHVLEMLRNGAVDGSFLRRLRAQDPLSTLTSIPAVFARMDARNTVDEVVEIDLPAVLRDGTVVPAIRVKLVAERSLQAAASVELTAGNLELLRAAAAVFPDVGEAYFGVAPRPPARSAKARFARRASARFRSSSTRIDGRRGSLFMCCTNPDNLRKRIYEKWGSANRPAIRNAA